MRIENGEEVWDWKPASAIEFKAGKPTGVKSQSFLVVGFAFLYVRFLQNRSDRGAQTIDVRTVDARDVDATTTQCVDRVLFLQTFYLIWL